jgi:hypothetical protein
MFRKMIEQALGELMEEMAPTRPTIDPVDQRRRPDMSQGPGAGEPRRAIGEAPVEPVRPASRPERPRTAEPVRPAPSREVRRAVDPRDQEGQRSNMGEGRNAPREIPVPEGRTVFREPSIPMDLRSDARRIDLRESHAATLAPATTLRHSVNPLRAQLTSPTSVRNAFRLMEILRPPVALRDIPGVDRNR